MRRKSDGAILLKSVKIDNAAVRQAQLRRLAQLRAERDEAAVQRSLAALRRSAEEPSEGNLLALSIEAARAKATVGEISAALEAVWGRYQPRAEAVTGVYRSEMEQGAVDRVIARTRTFEQRHGRRGRAHGGILRRLSL